MYAWHEFDETEPELEMLEWTALEREYATSEDEDPEDGGPAQRAGLNPGDRIISVNGEPVTGKSYGQVISLIQQTTTDLSILVVPKEEDILQLAYQTSSQSIDSDYGSQSCDRYSRQSSMETASRSSREARDRKVLSTSSLDTNLTVDSAESYRPIDPSRRTLRTSTSYTSGLTVHRDNRDNSNQPEPVTMNKSVFMDRRREFENRSAQENVNPTNSKAYSFGLYFPKKETHVNSAENLAKSVVIRRSRESVLHSTDSQENISKQSTNVTRNVPIEYRHSSSPDTRERYRSTDGMVRDGEVNPGRTGSSVRHSFPDSGLQVWTSPSRHAGDTSSPYGFNHGTPTPDSVINKRESYAGPTTTTTRQYVPVVNESAISKNQKMSASVDSIDPRSNVFHTEQSLRTAYNSNNSHTNEQKQQHQSPSSRTFIVKINGGEDRSMTPTNIQSPQASAHSYGTAFAVTRSPTSAEIEIRQKREPRILVSHRKKQFEERSDTTPPSSITSMAPTHRYKTEIEKFTTFRKFDGIQSRLASFEKTGSNGERSRSRSQTPVSAQPISRVRQMSQERIHSPEPAQSNTQYSPQGTSQSNYSDSAPIRIYVSQGSAKTSGSPIVEIVPMSRGQDARDSRSMEPSSVYSSHGNLESHDQGDGDGQKPVRKASFLSAVNAPYNLPQTGYDGETPVSETPKSSRSYTLGPRDGRDTPTSATPLWRMPSPTREDHETKLHRRTSYLMATAKDRSAATLTMSPGSSPIPLDPNTPATVMSKHKSMRKLKDFFGEKEKREPVSPIQQVTREGSLGVKVDVIDGKRASDRSWRPVWAVLRGHALFLSKERRDPANSNLFAYDEQPISIKACIVDIAHSYTKRKNVFRVKTYNGSEYLLQAEDSEDMLAWIAAIKENNNPDFDSSEVARTELIIRKSQELDTAPQINVSPPQTQKMSKKLSVLSIKQKIPHSPNDSGKESGKESSKSKTWKGKIGKSFKKHMGSSPSPSGRISTVVESAGMFGSSLEDCVPSPNNEFVPLIVDLCIQIVEARGLELTGVYRIPGNKAAVTTLQEEFNKGIDSMNLDHEKWADVNVISSLLKAFFRQLPEPLIPDDLYQPFIDANRLEDPERRMLKLKRLIHELPEHHFETFKHLARHMNKVAQYADINRMEAKNLAIVFGPTLIRKADDNMVAMFTDMSDHCKIIESITMTPLNVHLNPRDIVSSIVEAANRKLRGDVHTTPHLEKRSVSVIEPPTAFSERNIDQEILLRTKRIENTSRSSPNLAAMQRSAEIVKVPAHDTQPDRRMAKSQEYVDREFTDFDYIDSEKENSTAYLTPTTRYFSDESLLDRNDELELSHGTPTGSLSRLSRETINSLRRIEMEARALREREERRQREENKRKLEKQRIEENIRQTQQELEIEDRHSVEDLLNAPQFGLSNSDFTRRPDASQGSRSGTRSSNSGSRYSGRDAGSGGKYFVVKGNSGSSSRSGRPPRQVSVESLSVQSKRTGSLENMADGRSQTSSSRPMAHVRARTGDERSKRESSEIKRRSGGSGFSRNGSMRRGSLDSLIDLLEKRDNRMSWASTDSEEGYDLLTTLTSTFDQKLQTLSNSKLLHSAAIKAARRSMYNSSNSSNSNSTGTSSGESSDVPQHHLPPQVPLAMMSRPPPAIPSDPSNRPYRDPSLHRTPPKPDTKIGLATRFERTTTPNPLYEGHSEPSLNLLARNCNNNSNMNLQSEVTYSVDNAIASGSSTVFRHMPRSESDSRVSSVMVVISSPSVMSADSCGHLATPKFISKPLLSTQTLQPKWESHAPSVTPPTLTKPLEYRPISKSEKTQVNVKLSQCVDKNKMSSEIAKETKDISNVTITKSRSASPPPSNRKRSEKRKRRRHTVGGTADSENIEAISAATSATRLSAWEQLRPMVSHSSNIGPSSSMLTWLRNERLRASNPDIARDSKAAILIVNY
ncbi:RHG21-like protein [Mya arenaria]|uniref:RHG21-like protein n=1 Tax=Mya arenaria TaxID=6604 RepID=A0ABY7D8C2_MYAAR|nr:RHG21-like protein [Mya arenaria]